MGALQTFNLNLNLNLIILRIVRTTYGISLAAEPNCQKCRVCHVTTLPAVIPETEISAVRFLLCVAAERYILQQRCLKKWIGSALLGTRSYNTIFSPLHRPLAPQCTALQTEGVPNSHSIQYQGICGINRRPTGLPGWIFSVICAKNTVLCSSFFNDLCI